MTSGSRHSCRIFGFLQEPFLPVRCPLRRTIAGGSAILLSFLLLSSLASAQSTAPKAKPAAAAASKVFPYPMVTKTLPNGLKVTVVPAHEFKDAATFASVVMAGSRNEVHKGKTGLAHLFEHIMFLHEHGGKPEGYEAEMQRMGVDNNAFTDYDMTFYHPTTFTKNLFAQTGANGER